MSIEKNIRTATAGTPAANYGSNSKRDEGLLKQYFRNETKEFMKQKIPMTSALFDAEMQGVDYDDFYAWTPVKVRSSDLINPTTGEHLTDDWQELIIQNTNIDAVPIGAYIKYNDNIWIVCNPDDVGSVTGNVIVKRCNCTYNTYDYYGNVVRTPMSYSKGMALASANDVNEYINLPSTYQHIILQLNENTKGLHNNSRLILGGEGYFLTGITNFIRDYTLDPASCHIIRAECRLGEAQEANDDLVNEVAGGKAFNWSISITGIDKMGMGTSQTLAASSLRNGETPDAEKHPYDYLWESSDYSVITVDENGVCEAVGEGTATITCYLQQNTNVSASIEITSAETVAGKTVDFVTDVPGSIYAYTSVSIEAAIVLNGARTGGKVGYSLSGAKRNLYDAEVNGNVLTITSYGYCKTPLYITAWADDGDATGCEEANGLDVKVGDESIYEVTFNVDSETGEMSVMQTENLDGNLHFDVDEPSGELEVDESDMIRQIFIFNVKEPSGTMGVYKVPTSTAIMYLCG